MFSKSFRSFSLAFYVVTLLGFWLWSGVAVGQVQPTVITWETPSAVSFPTALGASQLNAVARSGRAVAVPLNSSYNITGITSDGFLFAGGFDASGAAYSAASLGRSTGWQGVTFEFGPADAPDAVTSATIPLPEGSFDTLLLLGALVNNAFPAQVPFTVTYTDGTSTTVVQGLSDWVNPSNYPGESLVQCAPTRHYFGGSTDANSVCVYGYKLKLDAGRTVASVTLPQDRNVLVLAMSLLPPVVAGEFVYTPAAGTIPPDGKDVLSTTFTPADANHFASATASVPLQVYAPEALLTPLATWPVPAPILVGTELSETQLDASASFLPAPAVVSLAPYYRVNALYQDGEQFNEKGFDGSSTAFSATQLGLTLRYAGGVYPLGPAGVPDTVTDSSIELPAGQYSSLYLVGAAANGAQRQQTFTVQYADGSLSAGTVDMSSWSAPQSFQGESVVATTAYADASTGGEIQGIFDIYGYQLALDPSKVVQTLVLPANRNVLLFGVGLGSAVPQSLAGTWVYDPPAGFVPALGTTSLEAAFSPDDQAAFVSTSARNSLVVIRPTLTVIANAGSRTYGTANPPFTGSISGAQPGDAFSESFTSTATQLSPAGQYGIEPAASGLNLRNYNVVLQPGTLTVTQAGVTVTLSAGMGSSLAGDTVTLTAQVSSTTPGNPTGLVEFYDGGQLLGSGVLTSGTAALPQSFGGVGVHQLRAIYEGDRNFSSGSGGASLSVLSTDFTIQAMSGAMTTSLGGSATIVLHLAPLSSTYPGTLTLSVRGQLPPLASTTFAPSEIAAGSGPCDVLLTVQTRQLTAKERNGHGRFLEWACTLPLACLALLGFRRRSGMRLLAASILTFAFALCAVGCGSGYHNANYPLVITATSGTRQHSVEVTLHIVSPNE